VGPEVSALVERVLDTAGVRHDRDVVRGIVLATLELIGGDASRLDLKSHSFIQGTRYPLPS